MHPTPVHPIAPLFPDQHQAQDDRLNDLEVAFSTVSDFYDDVARMALAELEAVLSSADADTTLTLLPDGNLEATSGHRGIALHRTKGGFSFQTLELIDGTWVASSQPDGYADDPESIRDIVSHRLGF